MLNAQYEKLTKNLLNDNEMLNLKLNQALDILIFYKEKINKSTTQTLPNNKHKYLNNLQAINIILSNLCSIEQDMAKKSITSANGLILSEINSKLVHLPAKKKCKTLNEIIAEQALEQFDWVKTTTKANQDSLNLIDSLENLEELITKIKKNRSSKFNRLYQPESSPDFDLLLNVCTKCTGQIKIV